MSMIQILKIKTTVHRLLLIIVIFFILNYSVSGDEFLPKGKLIERVNTYYDYERKKDWTQAYLFRIPAFRAVVPLNTYKRIMSRDSQNWQLLQTKILDIKVMGKTAQVKISFIDKYPEGYLPKSARSDSINITENTLWEKIEGIWHVRNPGGRSYFTLNVDLVPK